MAKNLKLFEHNVPYELCTSVRKGLPFVITPYIELILKGILASAQTQFPITICHLIVMANHIHMLIVVQDTEDVPRFMDHFKTESAHALNKLMGTTGESFWCEGYDSPAILSPTNFLHRMRYLYLNPVEANLCTKARNYKGISTYNNLLKGDSTETWRKYSRNQYPELPEGRIPRAYEAELLDHFSKARGINYKLKIEPWAWLSSYQESKSWKKKDTLSRFLTMLNRAEEDLSVDPEKVIPEELQRNREIRTFYRSKRKGKKMLCLSDCIEQRKRVIAFIKEKSKLARDAYKKRIGGDYTAFPPPGFFLPGGALLANLILPSLLLL